MSDSIGDLLDQSRFAEPDEIQVIKTFIKDNYNVVPSVTIGLNQIVVGVPNAALAGTLRPRLHELEALCQTKKRLVIRIGH